jgi:hypothetical protein
MKSIIFWDVTPCSLLHLNGLHGVTSQKMILFTAFLVRGGSKRVGPHKMTRSIPFTVPVSHYVSEKVKNGRPHLRSSIQSGKQKQCFSTKELFTSLSKLTTEMHFQRFLKDTLPFSVVCFPLEMSHCETVACR